MAHGLPIIFSLLCTILASAIGFKVVAASGSAVDEFVYSGFAGANVTLDGAAAVTPSGLLELTNGTLRQKAHAVHPSPFRFRNNGTARSFSASFVFGILCPDADACGHGIVLFVAPVSYDLSAALPSQYLGLVNATTNGDARDHLFGVELDTDQNNEFRDINGNHVGVDVNSLVSVSSASAGYYDDGGTFRNLTLASGEAMQVWVDYEGAERRVEVTMAPLGTPKPSRPLLSAAYDLSTVLTGDVSRVGFSSATGSFNSRHYVLGWSFAMDGRPAPAIDIAKLPKLPRFGPKKRGAKLAEIVPPAATAAFVLAVGAAAALLVRRRRRYAELREDWELEFGPHRFAYKDLYNATQGFKSKNLLGVGGFGRVYKGVLPWPSEIEVAVKKVSHDSKQGVREFIAEVVSIGRLQHRNLVQLLGYCRRQGELLLVYEYMSNGSLDKHLYGGGGIPAAAAADLALDWDRRFRIIKGIASGLLYLHEEWEKVIIHRDIKASNVLLDDAMDGRLGDFGLARLYDHGADPHTTHVVGTIGYLAPELGRTSKATPLSDVFAFGVFVLEVVCGQRPIKHHSSGDQLLLVDWVVDHWQKGSVTDAVDTRLHGSYNDGEAVLALKVGLMCSHPISRVRPSMRQVTKYLSGDVPLPELVPTHQSFESLAMMQNQGFDSYVMSYPSSAATMTSVSHLSGELVTARAPTHKAFQSQSFCSSSICAVVQRFSGAMAHTDIISFLVTALFLSLSSADGAYQEDQFVFSGFTGANLTLDGTATITANGLLELTNGTVQLKGHAFHPSPVRFRASPGGAVRSFSASFAFAILTAYPGLSCHGIAFAVAATPGPGFSSALAAQYLGLANIDDNGNATNHFFAAEVDTMQNVEFQDVNNNHVGVDINGLQSVAAHPAGYYDGGVGDDNGSFHGMDLISGEVMQAWVDYDSEATRIDVAIAPIGMAKPVKPLVSTAAYNLSDVLLEPSYVGFSSATGPIDSRHYILGWSFAMNGPAPAIDVANLPKLPRIRPKPRSKALMISLPIATAAFIVALGALVVFLVRRRLRYAELREDWEVDFGPHRFSYKDLFHATHGFDDKHLLGKGGFGSVYRGVLPESKLEVAVKRVSHESRQGMKEFIAEVVSIGRIRHRNLVQLLGYCRRKGELLLVYDYMSNGSLDRYLHYHQGAKPMLDWAQRIQIIKGVASGLLYLHDKWEKVVIHRDIKASNVLLDKDMNGRLGDFGLARLYDHGTDPQTTHMVGTMGYLAPELIRTGKASPLTDVFAFGTFILEVTCGQRPVKEDAQGDQLWLVDWVLEQCHNGALLETVDPRLQGSCDTEEACRVLKLGLLCAHPCASARPSMHKVMDYLDGDSPVPELASTQLSFHMLALLKNKGLDPYIVSCPPPSVMSFGSISDLSGGR
ncbi:hypothetical protein U9M48_012338 [Paspalum notatum var. saurae]|uniref:non-specific serine/threonine protein kinase n=1 Tax=Paspalum notatum var. saurae TaxID=547442 RepID=A0AAQ3SXA7_PASNO